MELAKISEIMRSKVSLCVGCQQAPDNSLPVSTFCVIEGQRIALHFPNTGGVVYWCLLTNPLDQVAFAVRRGKYLIQWLFSEATRGPYLYTHASMFATRTEALEAIAEAKARYCKSRRIAAGASGESIYDELEVVPVSVASDELGFRYLPVEVVSARIP